MPRGLYRVRDGVSKSPKSTAKERKGWPENESLLLRLQIQATNDLDNTRSPIEARVIAEDDPGLAARA